MQRQGKRLASQGCACKGPEARQHMARRLFWCGFRAGTHKGTGPGCRLQRLTKVQGGSWAIPHARGLPATAPLPSTCPHPAQPGAPSPPAVPHPASKVSGRSWELPCGVRLPRVLHPIRLGLRGPAGLGRVVVAVVTVADPSQPEGKGVGRPPLALGGSHSPPPSPSGFPTPAPATRAPTWGAWRPHLGSAPTEGSAGREHRPFSGSGSGSRGDAPYRPARQRLGTPHSERGPGGL